MKRILLIVAMMVSANAQAATAYLVSCQGGSSVTGRFIYTGTYQYMGHYFEKSFSSWCPQSIEIY